MKEWTIQANNKIFNTDLLSTRKPYTRKHKSKKKKYTKRKILRIYERLNKYIQSAHES